MNQPRRVAIVGAGLAGASAAATLRERDFDGEVLLFGQESEQPYELPALSKGILLGEAEEPDRVREQGFYAEHDISLHSATAVTEIDVAEALVLDSAGGSYAYDALVLATGSRPRTLTVSGIELAGIHTLRTFSDAIALREKFVEGGRVVVVGAGWIGSEVAAAARSRGCEVTVVEPNAAPLLPVLGEQIAGVVRDLHVEHGVAFEFGVGAEGFDGEDGVLRSVQLDNGSEIPADLVVLAVGASPRLELATAAGLRTSEAVAGSGVAVDAALLSSVPGVYAIGDIAAHAHPRLGPLRVEHWANAKYQGEHVAAVLLGEAGDYSGSPYFFSDQYDLGCEYRGLADPAKDELVVRGDLAARDFTAFWLREGAVVAAMNVNQWDDGDALDALVGNGVRVSAADLREGDLAALS